MTFLDYSRLKGSEFTGLSTFQFLTFFRRSIVYTFLSIYLKSLGLSTIEVTLMATVGMIANVLTQSALWGNLLDKYGRPTRFVVYGEFLAGVGHIFMVFGYTFFLGGNQLIAAGYLIIFSLGIIEVFWSMSNVGWSALISELTDDDERKKIMGQFSIIGGSGGLVGAFLGGFLYDGGIGFSSGSIFYIAAIIMILSSFIVYFAIRIHKEHGTQDSEERASSDNHSLGDLPAELREAFLVFILALIFINFGRNSIAIITSLFLEDPTGFIASGADIALYSNVGSIASMIMGALIGSVIAKSDDNKFLVYGVALSYFAISWLIFAPTFVLVLISSFLIGASHVIIDASSYSIVARIAPEEYRGRLFSYYNATFFLSWGIAATLVAGPVADFLIGQGHTNADAYRGSFVAALVMIFVGILILIRSYSYLKKIDTTASTELM